MAAVFVPELNMLVFDEFSSDKSHQRIYFKGNGGVPSQYTPINVYFAVYSVNECVTDATSFPLQVRTCVDAIPDLNVLVTKDLAFNKEVITDFNDYLQALPPFSFGDLPLAGNSLDWPDVLSVTLGGLAVSSPSSWLEVSSPAEGFRVALLFAHQAVQK